MRRTVLAAAACLALAACSNRTSSSGPAPAGAPDMTAAQPDAGSAPSIAAPQIAYRYHYDFRLPGQAIAGAQAGNVALCDRLGPARCHVVASNLETGRDGGESSLTLEVAAPLARRLGAAMAEQVAAADGRATRQSVDAEDVSRQIVDGQARLRQKEILVQRLTQILATRDGSIGDLVAAETQVAQEQANLDQLRSELAALQGRVATSTIEATYRSSDGLAGAPLGDTVQASWHAFAVGAGVALRLFIYLLPWLVALGVVLGAVALAIRALVRRSRPAPSPPPVPPAG